MSIDHQHIFVGGQWITPSSQQRANVINASTEEVIGSVPKCNNEDMDRAVAAARAAMRNPAWAGIDGKGRAAHMRRFADAIEKRGDRLAQSVSLQNGMPINVADQLESAFVVGLLRYYAALAENMVEEEARPSPTGSTTLVRREPVGVVGAIIPWNFPVALQTFKIAPALAAGCAIVIKPSSGTVLDSYVLAEAAAEAEMPPGVINWVPGDRGIGSHLVTHPGVDKVAFTGSTGAGKIIAEECARLLRPVTLELGGKSAAILLDDADLDAVLASLPMSSVLNNGQACFSCTRILAPASRYDEFVEAIASTVGNYPVGDALDRNTVIGPMASAGHRDSVQRYIDLGTDTARLVAGGGRSNKDRGFFVNPTVFADVDNNSRIAREEIFGPVLSIIRYQDEDEAIRIANDSEYGLGGTVWSTDREHAIALARRVETGTIGINGYMPDLNAPFGGVKNSGLGRELGPESMGAYLRYKSIYQLG
ncbi:aldehyde dehydrogenase [Denitromonas ohlonensis]|uniref:Aldehyde dehydrogenase n=2 Tax=Denitromonas TaxID=139331 RepID=A0A557RED2_9RHOO|nr:aldehyde dehydrogenase [Denitromonas ohlonensis]TVO63524.1 aldehyde dehydrogenase [Denitromonas ohlonensis]TVO75401.1 aldehyde dehydrogenase [Denitromonas ohlonensis]